MYLFFLAHNPHKLKNNLIRLIFAIDVDLIQLFSNNMRQQASSYRWVPPYFSPSAILNWANNLELDIDNQIWSL